MKNFLLLLFLSFPIWSADIVITVGASGADFTTINSAVTDSVVDVTTGNNAVIRLLDDSHSETVTITSTWSADTLFIEGDVTTFAAPNYFNNLVGGIYYNTAEVIVVQYLDIITGWSPVTNVWAGLYFGTATGSLVAHVEKCRVIDVVSGTSDYATSGIATGGMPVSVGNSIVYSIFKDGLNDTQTRVTRGIETSNQLFYVYNSTIGRVWTDTGPGNIRGIDHGNDTDGHFYNVAVFDIFRTGTASGNFREFNVNAAAPNNPQWSNNAYEDTAPNDVPGLVQIDPATDFVDTSAYDFTPASGSDLIDAGIDMSDSSWVLYTSDIAGNERTGTWDIGAIEFTGASESSGSNNRNLFAYPGAQGAGKFTRHAFEETTPTVYTVTQTAGTGAGTLPDALSAGNRIIQFDVSDTIRLANNINATVDNIWIQGATAPGNCVNIAGSGLVLNGADNWLIDNVSFARGDDVSAGDAINVISATHIYLFRCNVIWGGDESLDTDAAFDSVSIESCIIGETLHNYSQVNHAYSTLLGSSTNNAHISMFYSLIAHGARRNPKFQGHTSEDNAVRIDFVSNLVYGWTNKAAHSGSQGDTHYLSLNVRDNYFKELATGALDTLLSLDTDGDWDVYFGGNQFNSAATGSWITANINDHFRASASAADSVDTLSAPFAMDAGLTIQAQPESWIIERVGPINADSTTLRLRSQYINRTSAVGGNGLVDDLADLVTNIGYDYPTSFNTYSPYADADSDGIPDSGDLKPNTSSAFSDSDGDGYYDIEEWYWSPAGMTGQSEATTRYQRYSGYKRYAR